LDSLVDLISFGIAPAILIYLLYLENGDWSWTLSFLYASAVAMRLARFNIEQGGHAKRHFHGLPSPVAGVTVASFYPFSQTALFQQHFAAWPWTTLVGGGMIVLSGLMLSHVLYPAIPPISLRRTSGRILALVAAGGIALLVWDAELVVFPAGLGYVAYGALKAFVLGLVDRLPESDPLSEELDLTDDETQARDLEYEEMRPRWVRRRRRRRSDRTTEGDA
jgi:CDP-diacylglycerol--serine O-phosphatidyltransferase